MVSVSTPAALQVGMVAVPKSQEKKPRHGGVSSPVHWQLSWGQALQLACIPTMPGGVACAWQGPPCPWCAGVVAGRKLEHVWWRPLSWLDSLLNLRTCVSAENVTGAWVGLLAGTGLAHVPPSVHTS